MNPYFSAKSGMEDESIPLAVALPTKDASNPGFNQVEGADRDFDTPAIKDDVKVEVVPGSVLASLPVAPPEAQILGAYSQQGFNISQFANDSEYQSIATAQVVPPDGEYFSQGELNVLNAQAVPVAIDYDAIANAPPPPASGASSSTPPVALQPSGGAMPIMPGAYSPAVITNDWLKSGLRSRDPILNSREEILKFLNMHNTPPVMVMHIEGYHHETTTRTVNGKTQTSTRRVTDFQYSINLTNFIYPYGKITVAGNSTQTVEEMIQNYVEDTNKLRSLQLKKKVFWNTNGLEYLVRKYIRYLGWHRDLSITTKMSHKSIRICDDNAMAKMYDNSIGRVCMVLTVIPALVFCIMGSGHRERGLRSIFVIPYSALQVFDAIRPSIWIPARRGCTVS